MFRNFRYYNIPDTIAKQKNKIPGSEFMKSDTKVKILIKIITSLILIFFIIPSCPAEKLNETDFPGIITPQNNLTSLNSDFTADCTRGHSLLTVHFIDISAGNPDSWLWKFGDGENSTIKDPVHTYNISGKYNVTLTVSKSNITDTRIIENYITVENSTSSINFPTALDTGRIIESDLIINEIYYKTGSSPESEFIELYLQDSNGTGDIDVEGWYLTMYNGDREYLPHILNLDRYDRIAVYPGTGINQTDASNGSAIVYLAKNSGMLNNQSGEVGLYNNHNEIKDFVRYGGGNGTTAQGNWPPSDPGAKADSEGKSIQIHGPDQDNSGNWVSSSPSPALPNIFEWIIDEKSGIKYNIHNGIPEPFTITEGCKFRAPASNIKFEKGEPFNLTPSIGNIAEYLNYTYGYLHLGKYNQTEIWFPKGPETGGDNDIDIHVTPGDFPFGVASAGGINVTLANFNTTRNMILNKLTIEHEHVHLFQLNQSGRWVANDNIDTEGQAEFWGTEITMSEFNLTLEEFWDKIRDSPVGYGPENFLNDTNPAEHPFCNLSGKYIWKNRMYNYCAAHLFTRCISDLYGREKVAHIHRARNNRIVPPVVGKDAIVEAFRQQNETKNFTFEDILVNYTVCLWKNYNRYLNRSTDDLEIKKIINKSGVINPYGTDYEVITNASSGFELNFSGNKNTNYSITLLKEYENGTTTEQFYRTVNGTVLKAIPKGFSNITIISTQIDHTNPTNFTKNITKSMPSGLYGWKKNYDGSEESVIMLPGPGLSDWTIYVDYNNNSLLDPGEPFSVTDSTGYYDIFNISPGEHPVREILKPGWIQTYPKDKFHIIDFNPGVIVGYVYFGNKPIPDRPVVICKWETDLSGSLEDGDPTHMIPGSQFFPDVAFEGTKTIQYHAVVTDEEDGGDIYLTFAKIFHPGLPYGDESLKYQVHMKNKGYNASVRSEFLTACDAGLVTFNEELDVNQSYAVYKLKTGTATLWTGEAEIHYNQPAGSYNVSVRAIDRNGLPSLPLENRFYYLPVPAAEFDFSGIYYGNTTLGRKKWLTGDKTWNPGDDIPTVRCIGNVPVKIRILQDDMTFGQNADGIWNVKFSASADCDGTGDSGDACGKEKIYSPFEEVILPGEVWMSESSGLDFSITIHNGLPKTSYNGEMTLGISGDGVVI